MREIKFMAWDGEKFVSPDYIDRNGVAHWVENSIPTTSKHVIQFTGLHDKKGKEIYEGDILRFDSFSYVDSMLGRGMKTYELKIYWNSEKLCWWIGEDYGFKPTIEEDDNEFEIVGNIYEDKYEPKVKVF